MRYIIHTSFFDASSVNTETRTLSNEDELWSSKEETIKRDMTKQEMAWIGLGQEDRDSCRSVSQRDVIFQCRIVAAELRGTNSDMKIGGGLRRNRGGVQRGGVRPPVAM